MPEFPEAADPVLNAIEPDTPRDSELAVVSATLPDPELKLLPLLIITEPPTALNFARPACKVTEPPSPPVESPA